MLGKRRLHAESRIAAGVFTLNQLYTESTGLVHDLKMANDKKRRSRRRNLLVLNHVRKLVLLNHVKQEIKPKGIFFVPGFLRLFG